MNTTSAVDSGPDSHSAVAPVATRRRWLAVGLFVAWTVLVWGGRVRNALEDDTLSSSERSTSLTMAATFVAVAVLVAALAVAAARAPGSRAVARAFVAVLGVATAWTIGMWVWRIISIAGGDWSVGFVVVHLVLAVVSATLATWALLEAVRSLTTDSG